MARTGFRHHRKFKEALILTGALEPLLLGCIECLWSVAYASADPYIGSAAMVETVAMWPGETGLFCSVLKEVGLIDEVSPGRYAIHDLEENAPSYVQTNIRKRKKKVVPHGDDPGSDAARLESHGPIPVPPVDPGSTAGCLQKQGSPELSTFCENMVSQNRERLPLLGNSIQGNSFSLPPPAEKEKPAAQTPEQRPPTAARSPLWMAVAQVMCADAEVSVRRIGSVVAALGAADPPYTAEEVLRLPAILQARGFRPPPLEAGAILNYIGETRAKKERASTVSEDERLRRVAEQRDRSKREAQESGSVTREQLARLTGARARK